MNWMLLLLRRNMRRRQRANFWRSWAVNQTVQWHREQSLFKNEGAWSSLKQSLLLLLLALFGIVFCY